MLIIGCDFHTRYQQIAMAEDSTGELLLERRLDHQNGEAQPFPGDRNARRVPQVPVLGTWVLRLLHWSPTTH